MPVRVSGVLYGLLSPGRPTSRRRLRNKSAAAGWLQQQEQLVCKRVDGRPVGHSHVLPSGQPAIRSPPPPRLRPLYLDC